MMTNLETRYSKAIERIGGPFGLMALPEPIKEILRGNYGLETKTQMLEMIADAKDKEKGSVNMENQEHIIKLANHGACVRDGDELIPLTVAFYELKVTECKRLGCNALVYDMEVPGIDDAEMAICIWRDGHVDSGSMMNICECLAAR